MHQWASMVRPRDLVWSTLLIVLSSILLSISSHWVFNLCLGPIVISSVLATFKLNLLALSQQVRLLSSEVTVSLRSIGYRFFSDKVILVSLANMLDAASRRQLGRSLINIQKSGKGPRMLPCGTPQVTVLAVDRLPLTIHLWVLLKPLNSCLVSTKVRPFT